MSAGGGTYLARFFHIFARKEMNMDLLEIHNRIRLTFNKDMTGYLLPNEIDRALDRAQLQEFRHLYGDDRRLPDMPVAYGITYKTHTDLLPFKRAILYNTAAYNPEANPYGTAPDGVLVFPQDLAFLISITTSAGQSVKIISEDEIGIRLSSSLRPPTIARPVAVIGGPASSNAFVTTGQRAQFFPETAHEGRLYYLKTPAVPNLVGTIQGRQFVYDAINSTQMEWNATSLDRIIERAIAILGENMQEDKIGGDNYQKAMQ